MTKVKLTDRALSEKMYKELVCNNGFTVDFNGQEITEGYAVSRVFVGRKIHIQPCYKRDYQSLMPRPGLKTGSHFTYSISYTSLNLILYLK